MMKETYTSPELKLMLFVPQYELASENILPLADRLSGDADVDFDDMLDGN